MIFGTQSDRDTGAMFRAVVDRLPLLAWISGPDKRCTYFNKPWLDFTGRPLEAELGDGGAAGVHAADLQRCVETYVRAFDRREPFIMEYRLRRHDGEYRWILDNGAPAFDLDGSFCGYIGAAFDVTEFRRAEAERNLANDRLQLAMESGKLVCWERDLATDLHTVFGDLSSIFGIQATKHVAHVEEFRRLVHPDDRAAVRQAVEHALETRSPCAVEFRIVRPDGTIRWVAAKGQFYYSPGGDPERMLGVTVDITERKDNEESLRWKEFELEEAQRLAGVGSWHWEPETDTVIWSEELSRIAGRDPSLPGPTYKEHEHLYTREGWERLKGMVEEAQRSGTPYELDMQMIRTDGTLRWVRARGEARRDAMGRIIGLRGTVQDIAERKRAEEALSNVNRRVFEVQESERARIARDLHDDFGQRLALLAVGLGQLQALPQPVPSGGHPVPLETLQKQIAEIITDLQALSHELHPPRLLLLGVVAAMRGLCREFSAQNNVEVGFQSVNVPDLPHDISLCLFRVLQEALFNAVRHSQVRQFEVQLLANRDAVSLIVRDEGVGFDADASSRGAGLGLTSMKERLKLVSGELSIDSQPSRGTTVLARVPIINGPKISPGPR